MEQNKVAIGELMEIIKITVARYYLKIESDGSTKENLLIPPLRVVAK